MPDKNLDYNIDAAQGFGCFKNDAEAQLLDYVSTVNISCGFHAGDPVLIREFLLKCREKNLVIGAHIGFNDISGFGCRPMELSEDEIEAVVLYQLGALTAFAKSYKLEIEHVRPHGAMYRMAAENFDFALKIVKAVQKFDKWLGYTCLDNAVLEQIYAETGIAANREVSADRYYTPQFTPDWDNKKYISDEDVLNRIRTISYSSQIKLGNGIFMPVNCDTVHFDAKNPNAVQILKQAYEILKPSPCAYNKALLSGWV